MRTDDSEPSATHDGETYYFCSQTCKETFEEDPDEFAHQHPEAGASQDHDHH